MRYPNAAKGIKRIYVAEIISIIAALLGISILAILAVNKVNLNVSGEELKGKMEDVMILIPFLIYAFASIALLLLSFFLTLGGIINASRDEVSFKRALWTLLAGIVVSVAVSVIQNSNHLIANCLNIISTAFTMLTTLFVLEGICKLAGSLGKKEIVTAGEECRRLLIGTFILSAVLEIAMVLIPSEKNLEHYIQIGVYVLDIMAYILYIKVLAKARKMQ